MLTISVVTVSLPAMLSVAEGNGTVSVCVTLLSGVAENNEREFTVTLTTMDDSGE